MRTVTAILCALLLAGAACADMTARIEFDEDPGFEPMPDWLGNATANPRIEVSDGIASFIVPEPNMGMKWRLQPDVRADIGFYPWLVMRYRAINYDPGKPDYLVWVKTDGDRMPLFRGRINADGDWHTVAVNLLDLGTGTYVSEIAVQTQTSDAGAGRLDLDWIAFADIPPEDAETEATALGPDRVTELQPEQMQFAAQPGWLSNPAQAHEARAAGDGLRFSIAEAGRGMKWSAELAEPVEDAQWLAVRYRARGVRRIADYFVYIAETGGGSSANEQYCILLNDIAVNGSWNVAVGAVKVPKIGALAVQVQAQDADASIEIDSLRFSTHRPKRRVADTLAIEEAASPADAPGLPAGNRSLTEFFRAMGFDDVLEPGEYTIEGVPFAVRDPLPVTDLTADDAISIDVDRRTSEVLLLLGLRAPQSEEESYGGGALRSVTQPHRFLARLHYADGATREIFPISTRSGKFEIERGLGVYLLPADPGRPLARVELQDTMERGSLGVLAATVRDPGEPIFAEMHPRPTPPRPIPAIREAAPGKPEITVDGDRVLVIGQRLHAEMDASAQMAFTLLGSDYVGGAAFEVEPQPLFAAVVAGETVPPDAFALSSCEVTDEGLRAEYVSGAPPLTVTVRLEPRDDGSIIGHLSARNDAEVPADIELHGPRIGSIIPRAEDEDLWYVHPRTGCAISDAPVTLSETYGGRCPIQVMSVFLPAGGGVYLMTRDTEARLYRWHDLTKRDGRVAMGIRYLQQPVEAGESFTAVPTQIGGHPGDWHEAVAIYREWVDGWYQPVTPRKQWFREVFNFRQQFLHFTLPTDSGMFDAETGAYHFDEVLAHDAEMFGGVDYLHLFDWGWSREMGRCGDYEPWETLGGADAFRSAVRRTQDAGIPVGLYIEGMLVSPEADIAEQAKQWEMRWRGGEINPQFAPSMNMCSSHPGWREYLAGVYRRVQQQVGNRGFYIDQYGFANDRKVCWREDHPHTIPSSPTWGERLTTRAVRDAISPATALYTEETPCDVISQIQDGSFTYNIARGRDDLSPTHLNLFRFVFPDFKTIEIIRCDRPLGSNAEAVGRVFFNGEAIWLEGVVDEWFGPGTLAMIRHCYSILHENRDAFTSPDVTPLVPTLAGDIYANEFRCERGAVWTLSNVAYFDHDGPVLSVEHTEGARYADLWTGEHLTPEIRGGRAILSVRLSPRGFGCVAQWRRPTGAGSGEQ